MRIFKFYLNEYGGTGLSLPSSTRILSVGLDPSGCVCLWAEIDDGEFCVKKDFRFLSVYTGDDVPDREHFTFLGTVTGTDGIVSHIYQEGGEP